MTDDGECSCLEIYFSTADLRRPGSGWRGAYEYRIGWLVRKLSRSCLGHCSIGLGGEIIDPTLGGVRKWPSRECFLAHYPKLVACWIVPFPSAVSWDIDSLLRIKGGPIRSICRLISGGRIWVWDCVTICLYLMDLAEVDVPMNIVTPAKLWSWLDSQGYARITLAKSGLLPEGLAEGSTPDDS
tara:strand:- start:127 stop:678 length:552 start_codon:yes stop_codon:yes gene_type:complete